ncbi:MAG: hypothetical protein PCFJNLEI_00660 [Verrucomicrobiae bacterium]|nr:hypothetical protein [Verrucomicrobiae bacterium]
MNLTTHTPNFITLHLAPDGADTNPGTQAHPFATLERARDELRRIRQSGAPFRGAEVWLHEGLYQRTETFELGPADSGGPENPVCWRAAPGETARIVGGRPVRGFAPVTDPDLRSRLTGSARDRVQCANLNQQGITDFGVIRARGFCRPYAPAGLELFFNTQPLRLAQWPKDHSLPITGVVDAGSKPRRGDTDHRGGVFHYDSDRPARWSKNDDLWAQGMFGTVWADDMIRIAALDPATRTVQLAEPHLYGIVLQKKTGGYFRFVNVLEELSEPGEYYLDRAAGIAYMIPPEPAENPEILASILEDPMVAMENVSHVEWRGLIFEASRGLGVYLEGGSANWIVECEFRNLGMLAVMMGQGVDGPDGAVHEFTGNPVARRVGNYAAHLYANPAWNRHAGTGHTVLRCVIHDTGEGGILLGGGERRTLERGNNSVAHCRIYRTNRLTATYRPAIMIDGVGNTATHNRIEDLPHSAIMFEGNDHRIEYNWIANVVTDSDDGGAIYAGRDIAMHGNSIRCNFISGARGGTLGFRSGIYLDDQVGGVEVFGNILHNNSIAAVISGRHIRVENNLLIGNDKALSIDGRLPCDRHLQVLKALPVGEDPWLSRYPEVARAPQDHWGKPVGMTVRFNVGIGCQPVSFDLGIDTTFVALEGNVEWKGDAGFVDMMGGDLRFRAEAQLPKTFPWLCAFHFDRIGPSPGLHGASDNNLQTEALTEELTKL